MREFEKWELAVWKCPVCGCKNKIHTQLIDPNTQEYVGYTLKCCACGDYHEFFNEHESNGVQGRPNFKYGRQRCIQMSFCPHKDCKLYGTCTPKDPCKQPKKPCNCPTNSRGCCPPPQIDKVTYQIIEEPKFL